MLHGRTVFLLLYSLWVSTFIVTAQRPQSSITSFTDLPGKLFFFDDTETAIYHNPAEGNVYISSNEGKTWARAEGIPTGDANMVIEHPFDNRYAFVLTTGKTHYRTDDRGKSWRKFELPISPARVSRPLSFHSDSKNYGYILYQGTVCDGRGWGSKCHDETYYTKNAFEDSKLLLIDTSRCQFAHSRKEFKADVHSDLVFCVAFDATAAGGGHSLTSSRLFSSTDFFASESKIEDFGIGKHAKGVVAFAIVSRFGVAALRDLSSSTGEMLLYVTVDGKTWAKAHFPHASSARLKENAYTIVESMTWSLAVDVVLQDLGSIGTLFTSNSNGTFFVESLKDTNRNKFGYVDYERIYGVDGIGIANVVANAQDVEGRRAEKKLKSYITFDDGSRWRPIHPPSKDNEGHSFSCDVKDAESCSLHFHSITTPHNYGRIFSSPAPGIVMGVGSVGKTLRPYDECDTFLSTDAGLSWKMIAKDAHIYEFGDQGSILVAVNDEDGTDKVKYSLDLGNTWKEYELKVKLRARALITLPDSTSQKFLLLGQVSKKHQTSDIGKVVIVQLDFTGTRKRKCGESDFEKWYGRTGTSGCLMGHKQWYKRRKPDADCYVGEIFKDPVEHDDDCPCTEDDYECDYNFVLQDKQCVPVGPEPIEPGVCKGSPDQTYKGSSGYRKIPGNTCKGGVKKDEKVDKKCSQAQPKEGEVVHQTFEFQHQIVHHAYFQQSTTILVRLADHSIWQSSNEGYSWQPLFPGKRFLAFYHHKYSRDRAYLITDTSTFYYTTDGGRSWHEQHAPTPPNTFGAQVLRFHPNSDNLIWTGNKDCAGRMENCHAEAQYSRNNGRRWDFVDKYVRNCAWTKDKELDADPTEIMCESYRTKKGSQLSFDDSGNPLELVVGSNYFSKRKTVFERVVGFAKFSEFLVVASMQRDKTALELQVSLDGYRFATGQFPPGMNPETHAYTVLESSTKALFLHMTMSESPAPYWGNLLKSNSNGTYFGLALQNVNRDDRGYVDFEKMIGLDGIALVNVVSNPGEARVSNRKDIQTRITHNDGSIWKPLTPPSTDSLGRAYECNSVKCALHIHGYTERTDPRATYSSPSVPGLLMAVGNVGEKLAAYTDSDTFLSRDAGFTWQEVHKDAHLWEFGDSGSILVMVNDEEATDHVLFSTDEGLHWREYRFTDRKMRVRSIVTVTGDTSRRFMLLGNYPRSPGSVVVHLDFSALTTKKCVLSVEDPGHDDFELWSPSEERTERCLFGRQTLYHRRKRETNCVVGNQPKAEEKVISHCPCAKVDFECEFNYVKNEEDECVLVPGTTPLASTDEACKNGDDYWYDRTAYRLIPYSSCEGGMRRDRGAKHVCPGVRSRGGLWWMIMLVLPFGFTAMVGYYYYRRSGLARGTIRLPVGGGAGRYSGYRGGAGFGEGNWVDTLASVPWFLVGLAGIGWEWVASRVEGIGGLRTRSGYRDVPVDEDAQILRFEDENYEE